MSAPATSPARPRWSVFAGVVVVWAAIDQLTKFLAVQRLSAVFARARATTTGEQIAAFLTARPPGPVSHAPVVVVPVFWSFFYTENRGAFGSLGARLPEALRVPLFALVSVGALVLIAWYYRRLDPGRALLRWGLPVLAGGTLGNLVDRVVRGYVIDFVDWHLNDPGWAAPARHWFTFNWADVGITCGVALILLDGVVAPKHAGPPPKS